VAVLRDFEIRNRSSRSIGSIIRVVGRRQGEEALSYAFSAAMGHYGGVHSPWRDIILSVHQSL
jgi:hypothetical protein